MLAEDGATVRLLADPRRAAGAVRLWGIFATVCAVVAGWALLCGIAALLAPAVLTGLDPTDAESVRTVRWVAPGLGFTALLFGALAAWFWVARRRARRFSHQEYLVGLDPSGILLPGHGTVPFGQVSGVVARWARVRHPRPVGAGQRLGLQLGQRIGAGANQDETIRQITIHLHEGEVLTTFGGALATDADFRAFLERLERQLRTYGLPLTVERS